MPCSPDAPFRLTVKVVPNASRSEIADWMEGDVLKIRIQAPATDGKANKALIALLSKLTGVSKTRISIISGQSSRQKVIAFERLSASEWQRVPRR